MTEKGTFGPGPSHLVGVKHSVASIGVETIKTFAGDVARARGKGQISGAFFVSDAPCDPAAETLAREDNIRLLCLPDLLAMLIDFEPYTRRMMQMVEDDPNHLLEVYVDLTCAQLDVVKTLKKARQNHADSFATEVEIDIRESEWDDRGRIDAYVLEWLNSPDAPYHLSILGDFGAGKTSFCKHLTYRLLAQYRQGQVSRLPLYIPLKKYAELGQSGGAEALVIHYLANDMEVSTNFKKLEKWARSGRLLILLDGFDEMAQKVDDRIRDENFSELARLAQPPNKVILTGRPGYFPGLSDILVTFGHEVAPANPYDKAAGKIDEKLKPRPLYEILKLNLFAEADIKTYLDRQAARLHKTDPTVAANLKPAIMRLIEQNPQISELGGRPVLLWMIVEVLPDLLAQMTPEEINLAELYRVFTDRSLKRDWERGRASRLIPMDQRRDFMRQLAWRLQTHNTLAISRHDLERMVADFFETDDTLHAAHLVNDMCTCAFLTHDERDGYFKFVHKSFMEYYVARELVPRLTDAVPLDMPINKAIRDFVYAMLGNSPFEGGQRDVRWRPADFSESVPDALTRQGQTFVYHPINLEMRYIPPGPFIYGEDDETKVVTIEQGYFIGTYPVTQQQWRQVMGTDPSLIKGDDRPVEQVSWNDAQQMIQKLNARLTKEGLPGRFALPTEIQWEKAARGIDGRTFPWGDAEPDKALCNFYRNVEKTSPVTDYPTGQSPYGLFDCAGNVFDWCDDLWDQDDPFRVYRGGAQRCRTAFRLRRAPDHRYDYVGFRLVFVPQAVGSLSGHALEQKKS